MTAGPEAFLYFSADSGTTGREDFERRRSDPSAVLVVPGVGDEAYWIEDEHALHARRGDNHVDVKFAGSRLPDRPLQRATDVARMILPRAAAGR